MKRKKVIDSMVCDSLLSISTSLLDRLPSTVFWEHIIPYVESSLFVTRYLIATVAPLNRYWNKLIWSYPPMWTAMNCSQMVDHYPYLQSYTEVFRLEGIFEIYARKLVRANPTHESAIRYIHVCVQCKEYLFRWFLGSSRSRHLVLKGLKYFFLASNFTLWYSEMNKMMLINSLRNRMLYTDTPSVYASSCSSSSLQPLCFVPLSKNGNHLIQNDTDFSDVESSVESSTAILLTLVEHGMLDLSFFWYPKLMLLGAGRMFLHLHRQRFLTRMKDYRALFSMSMFDGILDYFLRYLTTSQIQDDIRTDMFGIGYSSLKAENNDLHLTAQHHLPLFFFLINTWDPYEDQGQEGKEVTEHFRKSKFLYDIEERFFFISLSSALEFMLLSPIEGTETKQWQKIREIMLQPIASIKSIYEKAIYTKMLKSIDKRLLTLETWSIEWIRRFMSEISKTHFLPSTKDEGKETPHSQKLYVIDALCCTSCIYERYQFNKQRQSIILYERSLPWEESKDACCFFWICFHSILPKGGSLSRLFDNQSSLLYDLFLNLPEIQCLIVASEFYRFISLSTYEEDKRSLIRWNGSQFCDYLSPLPFGNRVIWLPKANEVDQKATTHSKYINYLFYAFIEINSQCMDDATPFFQDPTTSSPSSPQRVAERNMLTGLDFLITNTIKYIISDEDVESFMDLCDTVLHYQWDRLLQSPFWGSTKSLALKERLNSRIKELLPSKAVKDTEKFLEIDRSYMPIDLQFVKDKILKESATMIKPRSFSFLDFILQQRT